MGNSIGRKNKTKKRPGTKFRNGFSSRRKKSNTVANERTNNRRREGRKQTGKKNPNEKPVLKRMNNKYASDNDVSGSATTSSKKWSDENVEKSRRRCAGDYARAVRKRRSVFSSRPPCVRVIRPYCRCSLFRRSRIWPSSLPSKTRASVTSPTYSCAARRDACSI